MFRANGKHSKELAKNRLENLLLSERMQCSVNFIPMMRNELIQIFGKYLPVDEERVKLYYTPGSSCIIAEIPVHTRTESEEKK